MRLLYLFIASVVGIVTIAVIGLFQIDSEGDKTPPKGADDKSEPTADGSGDKLLELVPGSDASLFEWFMFIFAAIVVIIVLVTIAIALWKTVTGPTALARWLGIAIVAVLVLPALYGLYQLGTAAFIYGPDRTIEMIQQWRAEKQLAADIELGKKDPPKRPAPKLTKHQEFERDYGALFLADGFVKVTIEVPPIGPDTATFSVGSGKTSCLPEKAKDKAHLWQAQAVDPETDNFHWVFRGRTSKRTTATVIVADGPAKTVEVDKRCHPDAH